MFVHEYSDERFATYEECADSLRAEIDIDGIRDEMDLGLTEILSRFLRRKTDQEFIEWFQEEIFAAEQAAIDAFITEYEDGEVD